MHPSPEPIIYLGPNYGGGNEDNGGGGGLVAKSRPTLTNPMDCSHKAPLSTGFSRQEYWSGLPFPSPNS